MKEGYQIKPIPVCKICGNMAEYGSMCNTCRDRIRKQKKRNKGKTLNDIEACIS